MNEKTIINCLFEYKGNQFKIKDIIPNYIEKEAAIFLYEDGNYSDDETRRQLINKQYGENTILELPLGSEEIELVKIDIDYI